MGGAIATGICDVRLQRTSNVTARKPYECSSCGERIKPSDRYRYTVVFWRGGSKDTWRHCQMCAKVADLLMTDDGYYCEEEAGPLGRFWERYRPEDIPSLVELPFGLPAEVAEWLQKYSPENEED